MGARGERVIATSSGEISILFTNRALADAEQRMNKSVLGVARDLANGQAGIGDVAQLLRAGMQAANRDHGRRNGTISLNSAYDLMDEIGFGAAMTAVMEAVTDVLMYRGDSPGAEDDDPNQ